MPDHEPWYKDGLHFTCTQCGNCCTGDPGVVWVNDEELREIADFLDQTIGEVRLMHSRLFGRRVSLKEYANGDCTFFDPQTRRCHVYSVRPQQCRTWPFWRSNLSSEESWKQVQQDCPGSGHGEFISIEDLESQAAKVDI